MSVPLNLSVPCSLVVYQYYRRHGFDALFHNILRLVSEKEYRPSQEQLPAKISHRLHVPVTADKVYHYGYALTPRAIIQLNVLLEAIMRDRIRKSFLDELASCRRHGNKLRIKEFVDDVLLEMGLTEEAKSFDTVKKDLQRFCQANKISYKELKKRRKNVPKLKRTRPDRPEDGIPLLEFLKSKGIGRSQFYDRHKEGLRTFKYKGRLYVHIDNFAPGEVYFSDKA